MVRSFPSLAPALSAQRTTAILYEPGARPVLDTDRDRGGLTSTRPSGLSKNRDMMRSRYPGRPIDSTLCYARISPMLLFLLVEWNGAEQSEVRGQVAVLLDSRTGQGGRGCGETAPGKAR